VGFDVSLQKSFVVIKIGGELLKPEALGSQFFADLKNLSNSFSVVLVHGGGPQMNAEAERIGHHPDIRQGRRITGDKDLEILLRVLGQELNDSLVTKLSSEGIPSVGMKGSDGIVIVEKRPPIKMNNEIVDFGWVGDVQKIETVQLLANASESLISVIATMGCDSEGQVYNVNGDTVAAAIAEALSASILFYVSGVGQVMNQSGDALAKIDRSQLEQAISSGWIQGGMRVKLETGFACLEGSRDRDVVICDGDSLLSRSKSTVLES